MPYIPCPITDPLELGPEKRYRAWSESQGVYFEYRPGGAQFACVGGDGVTFEALAHLSRGCPIQVWTDEPQEPVCPICNGKGMVEALLLSLPPKSAMKPCEWCEGSGRAKAEEIQPLTLEEMNELSAMVGGFSESIDDLSEEVTAKVWLEPQPFGDSEGSPKPLLAEVWPQESTANGKKFHLVLKWMPSEDPCGTQFYIEHEGGTPSYLYEIQKFGSTKQEEVKG